MAAPIADQTLLPYTVHPRSLSWPIQAAFVALAVALTALSAQFTLPLPFTVVPFVFTPMAVVLVGATLGSRLGAIAQATYVLAGALGLAVFAPSATLPPGLLRLAGPTGGYLLAYPVAAFVVGYLVERGWGRRYFSSVVAMLAGLAVIYIGGVSWLAIAFTGSLLTAFSAGAAAFLALDVLKVLGAAFVLPAAWRLVR